MTLSSDGEPPTTRWELESLTISGTPQDKGSWDFIEIASPIQDGALIVTGGVCNTPQFTITKAVANEWSVEKTDVEDSSVCPKDRLPLKRLAIKVLSGNLAVAQTTSELVLTNGDAVATFKR